MVLVLILLYCNIRGIDSGNLHGKMVASTCVNPIDGAGDQVAVDIGMGQIMYVYSIHLT